MYSLTSRSIDAILKRKIIVLKELETKLEVLKTIETNLDTRSTEAQLAKEAQIFNNPDLVSHLKVLPKIEGNWPLILLRHIEIIAMAQKLQVNLTKFQNLFEYTKVKEGITLQSDLEDIFANGQLAPINLLLDLIFKLHQDMFSESQKQQWNASKHHDPRLEGMFTKGISSMVYEIPLNGRIPPSLLKESMMASEDGLVLNNYHSGYVYGSVNQDDRLKNLPAGDELFLHYFPQDCSAFVRNLLGMNDQIFSTKLMRFFANLVLEELGKQGIEVIYNQSVDLSQCRLQLLPAFESLSINYDYLATHYPKTNQWIAGTLGKNEFNPDDLTQLDSKDSILVLLERVTKVNYLDSTINRAQAELINKQVDNGNQVIFWNTKEVSDSIDPFVGTKGGHTGVLKKFYFAENATIFEYLNVRRNLPSLEGLFLSVDEVVFRSGLYTIFEFK